MAEKPHINLVTIGHVDHGKSTLVGRLLWDTGNIPEQEMRKLEQRAKELKKDTFAFAYVMDKMKEEQERGVTIDIAHKKFETDKYMFTLIDAPGHRDFVKNMITGASQADAAILVVAANDGVMPQTKEHLWLSKTLGIKQFIIAINKMDTVDYSKDRFEEVKAEMDKLLQAVGQKEYIVVPISAYHGDNVAKKSDKMPWWDGPTLLEALDNLTPPEQPIDKPLRIPVQDVFNISGIGAVVVGRVESGTLKPDDEVIVMPKGKTGKVKSIEMHHQPLQEAKPGDNIGISIRGIGKDDVKRGDMIGHTSNPPTVAKQFTAQIIVLQHPTVITVGYTPVFHVGTAHVAGKIVKIEKKINPRTGEVVEENPDFIKQGDAAVIVVEPQKPLCIETASDFPKLASFAIRDMGKTIAAGKCLSVVKKED